MQGLHGKEGRVRTPSPATWHPISGPYGLYPGENVGSIFWWDREEGVKGSEGERSGERKPFLFSITLQSFAAFSEGPLTPDLSLDLFLHLAGFPLCPSSVCWESGLCGIELEQPRRLGDRRGLGLCSLPCFLLKSGWILLLNYSSSGGCLVATWLYLRSEPTDCTPEPMISRAQYHVCFTPRSLSLCSSIE